MDRFVYENPRPDWVVLVEETIVKAVNFPRGTPDGTRGAGGPVYKDKTPPCNNACPTGEQIQK